MEDRVEGNVLLSIANKCVRLISKRHGVDIDIYSFPLDDPKVYDLIKAEDIWNRIKTEGEHTIHRRNATYDAMVIYQCYWLKAYYPEEYKDALVPLVYA